MKTIFTASYPYNCDFDNKAKLHGTTTTNTRLAPLRSDEVRQNCETDAVLKPSVGHDFKTLKINKPSTNKAVYNTHFLLVFPVSSSNAGWAQNDFFLRFVSLSHIAIVSPTDQILFLSFILSHFLCRE